MRGLSRKRYLFHLALLLVSAGVCLGIVASLRGPGSQSMLQLCIKVPGSVAHVSDLEKYLPFTLYGPSGLPTTEVRLETRRDVTSPGTYVTMGYRHAASGSFIGVTQTSDGTFESEGMVPLEVDGKRVRLLREETETLVETRQVLWEEGDVLISVGTSLQGGMRESDLWPIIASFAPISSQVRPGEPVRCTCSMLGPLSAVQKGAPFTVYAPTYLPAGFAEINSGLETRPMITQDSARPVTWVNTRYRHPSFESLVVVEQTDARVAMDYMERYERVQVGEKTVWLERGETFGRPEMLAVHWFEGDVHVHMSVMLKGGLSETDFWAMVASVEPVSS